MRRALLAGLLPALSLMFACCAAAQTAGTALQAPDFKLSKVDWEAAAKSVADGQGTPREIFATLNAALAPQFAGIAESSVPVLLPINMTAVKEQKPDEIFAGGFKPSKFFLPGPAGYDATFFIKPDEVPALDMEFSRPVEVQITGASYVYELDGPSIAEKEDIPRDFADFPGIRRVLREAHVRYSFERFGVPYVVAIQCFDGRVRARRLSCKGADKIAARFLRSLQTAGGTPQTINPPKVDLKRPEAVSDSFTYHSPGSLIANSGFRSFGGRADSHVYARIRFPLSQAPAFAKSQSFNPWGDCYMKGKVGRTGRKGALYHCRLNDRELVFDESAPENFSYPWRDNFCETRDSQVGQCPGGWGHQGQDIRPSSCTLRNASADRCEPYHHDVVAVRQGMVWRNAVPDVVYETALIVVNTADDHIRFRYMHMNPKRMNADGLLSGRRVALGEVIGQVGTYNKKERGTSYHLHFDMQVFTRDGWVWVNPYMTLVTAYERLIGARGVEITEGMPEPAAVSPVPPQIEPPSTQIVSADPSSSASASSKAERKSDRKAGRKSERKSDRKHAASKKPPKRHAKRRSHTG